MENTFDFIIIGGGVAGLAAAQYGSRANLKTLVIENAVYGGQALQIFDLENYPGVFPAVHGGVLCATMKKQAESFGAQFIQTSVESIDKTGNQFIIKTGTGELKCLTVLIATGAKHRNLDVPGEKEFAGRGVSYCASCDGPFFKNKKIVVIGGGDSACDEATYLSTLSDDVTIVHRKNSFRAQKAVAERVLNNPKIKKIFNSTVKEIKGKNKVESIVLIDCQTQKETEIVCDGIFIFVGMLPQTSLVDMLPKDSGGYIKTDEAMCTVVPGMYVAGDIRSKPFRQIVTATSDGAIAAWSASKYIMELNNEVYK
jgi:thioredoxin reductase (NADPH)